MTEYRILPDHLAILALRSSQYRNPTYALAQLIDNAIQVGASRVAVLCREAHAQLARRTRPRLSEIAVLDDGSGMTAEVLRAALHSAHSPA